MATAHATTQTSTSTPTQDAAIPLAGADVVKRGIKRVLPCKLTEREFMQIAKTRVDKEALLDQIEEDFADQKKKHNDQVDELEGEIGKMRKELHTGEQDRTVLCVDIFVHQPDGTGWVHTLRMDTLGTAYVNARAEGMSHAEAAELARERATVERRPATPTETQRHLPDLDGTAQDRSAPLLDQAAARQGRASQGAAGRAGEGEDDGVPAGLDGGDGDDGLDGAPTDAPGDDPDADLDDTGDEDGESDADADAEDETPAQRSVRQAERGRKERAAGRGRKRGGKGGGK